MFEKMKNNRRLVILGMFLVVVLFFAFSYSFALFQDRIVGSNLRLEVGTLTYSLNGNSVYQTSVAPGEELEIEITLTSLASVASKYQMWYKSGNDLTNVVVGYSSESTDLPSGEMSANGEKKVTVVIQNNSASSVTITVGVTGGLANNSVEDIILASDEKKIETSIELAKYDIQIASVKIDGQVANSLPTSGTYTLSNYTCEKGSTLTWDTYRKAITFSAGTQQKESCSLEFTTSTNYPLLTSIAKQGDYVAYEGNNGCMKNETSDTGTGDAESGNSCLGHNANETLDTNGNTYGYCYSSNYKFYVKGWRIAYTEDNRAYLVSAGSPECNTRTSSTANATYINEANEKAKKYCNSAFVDGDCSDNSDAWAISDTDFYKMTSQIIGGEGRHLTSYYGSSYCDVVYSNQACGYNNDLIDNGGFYWFAASSTASDGGVCWYPHYRYVFYNYYTYAYGLRPIIRLSSSVYVTGGSGTMDDPYTIAN